MVFRKQSLVSGTTIRNFSVCCLSSRESSTVICVRMAPQVSTPRFVVSFPGGRGAFIHLGDGRYNAFEHGCHGPEHVTGCLKRGASWNSLHRTSGLWRGLLQVTAYYLQQCVSYAEMIKERDRVSRLRLISPLVSLLVSLTSVRSGDLLSSVTF